MSDLWFSMKTYDYNNGFSTAFRQWKADSHCRFIHGYALRFEITFVSPVLDKRNFVVDFGGLKSFKQILEDNFDHKLLVAKDDPEIEWFREGHRRGILDMVEVEASGCEATAKMVYEVLEQWLIDSGHGPNIEVYEVIVREHSGNAGGYRRDKSKI
jgi:6-pyruvoyltetrahydropterin/6-carboxytetrahydropterin synthase